MTLNVHKDIAITKLQPRWMRAIKEAANVIQINPKSPTRQLFCIINYTFPMVYGYTP